MQFKFDSNQDYQIRAIEAVTGLFEGQPRIEVELTFKLGFAAVANRLNLEESAYLINLRNVQSQNGITPDDYIACIEESIQTAEGQKTARFPNFSVEMETGTGKTYVYLRTALELYRRYGLRKFIIVVPSIAIREGILKTLKITETHLRELYDNVPYRYQVYDSESLSKVLQFALSDSVELMVMTIDSFNKASNVIRQMTDRLQGETPIHLIQATRPVLILDEPQNMVSELSIRALSALDPLFALRYSATHRNPYSLAYRLTPYEAYRQGLVKRIEVASVLKTDDVNQVFLRLVGVRSERKKLTARIAVQKLMKDGAVKEKIVTVAPDDSLEQKTERNEYAGFDVEEISLGGNYVRFGNGFELKVGESLGADKEAIFEAQIRYTIEEHFRKQARLLPQGIKVLSLFFIDRVNNYRDKSGLIRQIFHRTFQELKSRYPRWKETDPEEIQAAYFAQKRRKGGVAEMTDSISGKSAEDEEAYDLIMKDKERLLSLEEPRAFIFSHSALREGWDNPNVFQICTLNDTVSEIKKRQEIGRGMRLAVDQGGKRVRDEKVNILTVVANQSYERYVERLQAEIEEDYGKDGLPPKPANARKRGIAKIRKAFTLKPEFKELWERIKHKTRYAVKINTEELLRNVAEALNNEEIRHPRITITKVELKPSQEDTLEALPMSGAKTVVDLAGRYPLPNLVEMMAHLMEHTSPPVRLTRATLLEVFRRTKNRDAATHNPAEFAAVAVRVLKEKLADHLVDGIQYEKINEWYEMTQLETEIESWMDYMVPSDHSVYDHVVYESEVEKQFACDIEKRGDVKLYLKLPGWFTVSTPVGEYNPDWAIVMEERDAHGQPTGKPLLYLIRETKADTWKTELRPNERRKVQCGEKHFKDALGVDYKIVSNADELP
jgi:type III restriction enzyme